MREEARGERKTGRVTQLPIDAQQEPPINPRTLVDRIPGIDARCEAGKNADSCRWPFCGCRFPDRPAYEEAA